MECAQNAGQLHEGKIPGTLLGADRRSPGHNTVWLDAVALAQVGECGCLSSLGHAGRDASANPDDLLQILLHTEIQGACGIVAEALIDLHEPH